MVASFPTPHQAQLFEAVVLQLQELGYQGDLLQRDYRFGDWFSAGTPERVADAAAFAQTPLSADNACFAVVVTREKSGAELISNYRSLGAPRAFEVLPDKVLHWRVNKDPAVKTKPQVILPDEIAKVFHVNADAWKPERILRLKNIGPVGPQQRDF